MAKNDGVNIPVRVTGSAESQEELRKVGGAVKELGGKGSEAGKGLESPGEQARKSGESVQTFSNDAKRALGSMLDTVMPGFGRLFNMVTNVAQGISRVSVGLLGMAGFGLVLAGAVAWFQRLAAAAEQARKEIERVNAARKAQRDDAGGAQQRAADAFMRAGLITTGRGEAAAAARMGREAGIEEQTALFGLAAQQLGGLSDADRQAVMAAFVHGGMQAGFTQGDRAANERMIQRMVAAGKTPEAQAALGVRVAGFGPRARAEAGAGAGFDTRASLLDDAVRRVAADLALSDDDIKRLRRLADFADPASFEAQAEGLGRRTPAAMEWFTRIVRAGLRAQSGSKDAATWWSSEDPRLWDSVPGSDRSPAEFAGWMRQVTEALERMSGDASGANRGVTLEVKNYYQTNNIGAQFTDGLDRNRQLNPDVLDWGMQ